MKYITILYTTMFNKDFTKKIFEIDKNTIINYQFKDKLIENSEDATCILHLNTGYYKVVSQEFPYTYEEYNENIHDALENSWVTLEKINPFKLLFKKKRGVIIC